MADKKIADYDNVIIAAHHAFKKEINDNGTAFMVLRPISIIDKLFMRVDKIKKLEKPDLSNELIEIVNDAALGHLKLGIDDIDTKIIEPERALLIYESSLLLAQRTMISGTAGMPEVFGAFDAKTFCNLVIDTTKSLHALRLEGHLNNEIMSEKFIEIINFAIFALMILSNE